MSDKNDHPFVIRPYVPADREPLDGMYEAFSPKRCAQGLPPEGDRARTAWLDRVLGRGYHLVVVVNGAILGHGMLIPFDDDAAELANFLHQSIRDRGIGTALNRVLVELARHHGIDRLWLSVEPSNRPAIRSYEKAGFRRRAGSLWAPEMEMEVVLAGVPD